MSIPGSTVRCVRTGVVTPEAVVLDLPTAGVATRAFARVVDLLVQLLVAVALTFMAVFLATAGVSPVLLGMSVFVLALIVWPVGLEILWRGRSVGKAMFGLWVISSDGSPVQPRQSVVRGLLALIDIYLSLGFLALITAMFSPSSQRLGDVAASTVVVRHLGRSSATGPVVFYAPPGYEAYVANLDVGRLSPEDFSLIREFLLRVHKLSGDARLAGAIALADGVRERIDHQLTFAVDAETWLVCVAAAFQWREGGLLRDVARGVAPVMAAAGPAAPPAPAPPPVSAWTEHRR